MPNLPLVSWVLCTHVGGKLLHEAISSCLNQTFTDFELIIIINGRDASAIKCEINSWKFANDPRIRIYQTEVIGLSFSLSLGMHAAKGKYIARMDSDDVSYPNRLSVQVEFMENNPEISVLGSAFEIIDLDGNPKEIIQNPLSDRGIRQLMIFKNPICHPSVVMRREVILMVGGYLGGHQSEDYDLWLRISLLQNIKFSNLSKVLLGYRCVGVGNARKSVEAYASMAGSQLRTFITSGKIRWLLAVFITMFKVLRALISNAIIKNSLQKKWNKK